MNEVIQKRIEEAAKKAKTDFLNRFNWSGNQETGFKKGAVWMLNNLWISVEEALPEVDGHGYSKPVLVMSDTNELLVATYSKIYDKWNVVGPVSYHRLVVTHWMTIPQIEGGEK